MICANLIPAERLARKRRRRRLRIWAALSCGYTLALVAALALGHATWGGNNATLADEIKAAEEKNREAETLINALSADMRESRAAFEAGKAVGNQPDWSVVLVLLGEELADEIVLDGCEMIPLDADQSAARIKVEDLSDFFAEGIPLTRRRFRLRISGFGRTQTAVSRFVLRLERIDLFDEVKLIKSNRRKFLTGEAVAFLIECSI